TGGHVFQRQSGEFVLLCGNGQGAAVLDSGWNLGGTYFTERIKIPNLTSATPSLYWKNIGAGSITAKYRTGVDEMTLGLAAWKDVEKDGSIISPGATDTWVQFRFDFLGSLQNMPGAKSRVWLGVDGGGP